MRWKIASDHESEPHVGDTRTTGRVVGKRQRAPKAILVMCRVQVPLSLICHQDIDVFVVTTTAQHSMHQAELGT